MKWQLRPAAARDLAEIWLYTDDRWGSDQADRYAEVLRQAFDIVLERPNLGKPVGPPGLGLRRFSVRSHYVIFQTSDVGIDIVRILHQRMDIDANLG